jgi:hypothetical protein
LSASPRCILAVNSGRVNGQGVLTNASERGSRARHSVGRSQAARVLAGKEVLEMRNRLLVWLPLLTALALASLGAMDWGP